MTVIDFPNERPAPDWLSKYYEKGFRLVFYPNKLKGPIGAEATNWTQRTDLAPAYREGMNAGAFLGHPLAEGQYLVDIDFDWVPGIELSGEILPISKFVFGHPPSKPISHAFYTSPIPLRTKRFENIQYDEDDKTEKSAASGQCLVELRGTKEDGSIGFQTMVPPSVHPCGERLEFYRNLDKEVSFSDNIERRIILFAIACLLHANIPRGEFKHKMRLAAAGFFLKSELTKEEATAVLKAVVDRNGPHDKGDEVSAINSTVRAIAGKHAVVGRAEFTELLGRYGNKIINQINKWLGGTDFIESKGRIIPNQENIRRSLELRNIKLSYNEFSGKPIVWYPGDGNGSMYHGELEDNIRRRIYLETEPKHHFLPIKTLFYDVMDDVAYQSRFHPVIQYLKNLKWDGINRLEQWVIRAARAEDTEYVRSVSAIMLMAAVRRVTQPGCKYDEMVIFESGKQGLMKSTALRTLCPNEDWFCDNLPLNLKAQELIELTSGKWIIEASELNKMKGAQMEHIKGLLSRQDDTARLAYRHDPKSQKRQFIIVGTTNSYGYLTDQTGNRRFWPIRVNKFDIPWLREVRDQLWAEAFVREQNGESIRLPEHLYVAAEKEQESRLIGDDWADILNSQFIEQYQRVANNDIYEILAIPAERRHSQTSARIASVMQSLGFTKASSVRDKNGKVSKGWIRNEVHSLEEWERLRAVKEEELKPTETIDIPFKDDK